MELQYYGGTCLKLTTKKAQLVVDDNLTQLGLASILQPDNIALHSRDSEVTTVARLTIQQPGEYEASDISIRGVSARAYGDEAGQQSATIFQVSTEDVRLVFLGHISPEISDEQLEAIGTVEIAIIPVGNAGYTLSGTEALEVIKKINPKIVIPVYYADPKIKYPVAEQALESALKEMAMEPQAKVDRLKLKNLDLPEALQLIVLERQ